MSVCRLRSCAFLPLSCPASSLPRVSMNLTLSEPFLRNLCPSFVTYAQISNSPIPMSFLEAWGLAGSLPIQFCILSSHFTWNRVRLLIHFITDWMIQYKTKHPLHKNISRKHWRKSLKIPTHPSRVLETHPHKPRKSHSSS